jgi:hypothetical protein
MTQTRQPLVVPCQRPRIGTKKSKARLTRHQLMRPRLHVEQLSEDFATSKTSFHLHTHPPDMRYSIHDEQANAAGWEAVRGAVYGAAKYGVATALLGGIGHAMSPIYRGLTIQFKV